eukprot:7178961-Alexandrium_andersonii.AAC.1
MSASLVGSEMCIRDSRWGNAPSSPRPHHYHVLRSFFGPAQLGVRPTRQPVSYTHLTLPTICSV